MNFEQFMEEYKPFPKDKVNRQIAKKEKTGEVQDKADAHSMKAVRNYVTRSTDRSKRDQAFTGSDRHKTNDALDKHQEEQDKRYAKAAKHEKKTHKLIDKGKKKKARKEFAKAEKQADKGNRAGTKANTIKAVARVFNNQTRQDADRQAEINKKDKEDRRKAKAGLDRAKLEAAYKAKPQKQRIKGPRMKNVIRKESAFTDYVDNMVTPLYEKEGDLPKCPPGYRYDKNTMMCVPKSQKDAVSDRQKYGDKDLKPGNNAGYNTFGNSGYAGGYAFEEPPTYNDTSTNGDY